MERMSAIYGKRADVKFPGNRSFYTTVEMAVLQIQKQNGLQNPRQEFLQAGDELNYRRLPNLILPDKTL